MNTDFDKDQHFKKSRILCWCVLLTSGIVYGSSFSWMKIAIDGGANPLGMVLWFAIIATVALAIQLLCSRKFSKPNFKLLSFCLPWAILSVIFPNLFFFYAAGEIQASLIAVTIALVPILTLLGAILLKRDKPTFGRVIGIILGAIGVLLILLPETSLPEANDTFFVLIAFAGAACYAAEHLFIEVRFPRNETVDRLLFLMFLSASTLLLPVVLITGTFISPQWPLGLTELAIISIAGVTLLDYFFITLLILWAGPVFTSQAAYIVTLAGVVWGIVIFDDSHSSWVWSAIVILIIGLIFVRPKIEVV